MREYAGGRGADGERGGDGHGRHWRRRPEVSECGGELTPDEEMRLDSHSHGLGWVAGLGFCTMLGCQSGPDLHRTVLGCWAGSSGYFFPKLAHVPN